MLTPLRSSDRAMTNMFQTGLHRFNGGRCIITADAEIVGCAGRLHMPIHLTQDCRRRTELNDLDAQVSGRWQWVAPAFA